MYSLTEHSFSFSFSHFIPFSLFISTTSFSLFNPCLIQHSIIQPIISPFAPLFLSHSLALSSPLSYFHSFCFYHSLFYSTFSLWAHSFSFSFSISLCLCLSVSFLVSLSKMEKENITKDGKQSNRKKKRRKKIITPLEQMNLSSTVHYSIPLPLSRYWNVTKFLIDEP